jgi:protease-4
VLRVVWVSLKGLVFLTGLLVLAGVIVLIVAAPWERERPDIPDRAVLDISFGETLSEKPVSGQFLNLVRDDALSLFRLVRVIDRAAADPRIASLEMDLSVSDLALSHAGELAAAVARFRAAGKPARVFSTWYDLPRYRLAAAFSEIWMPRSGDFAVGGLAMQTPYAGELADDLGIEPQLERRKRYKSAADIIAEREMSPDLRAAFATLLETMHRSVLDGIAADRPAAGEDGALAERFADAFWNPARALELGLIDGLAFRHEFEDAAPGPVVDASDYLAEAMTFAGEPAARVALVTATGQIEDGRANPLDAGRIAAESLIDDLLDAAEADEADAILLRIDSPGGGYGPSDAIAAAIESIDKPVVVSMGPVAGSGGYIIAMPGDRIVAHETTITGSIGVIGGKIVVADLLSENGVRIETVEAGRDGDINSPATRYSLRQRRMLADRIDDIYDAFTADVARHRGMTPAEVEAAAQGRVWTGVEALRLGLIDRTGGFREALEELSVLLGNAPVDRIHVAEFPARSPYEQLLNAADLGFAQARAALTGGGFSFSRLDALLLPPHPRAEMPRLDIR